MAVRADNSGARAGEWKFYLTYPDVPVSAATIHPKLDNHGYIVPGLGDAADGLFGK